MSGVDDGLLRYVHPERAVTQEESRPSRAWKGTCLGCGGKKPKRELDGPVRTNMYGESGRICRGCTARREWREGIMRRMQEEQERLRAMPLPPGVSVFGKRR
jgi:hypothetical protein